MLVAESVRARFVAFSERFEGRERHMYLDIEGWVTTGIGNKIDPVADAFRLTWYRPDGTRAKLNEVQEAWIKVKDRPDLAKYGGGKFASLTTIRLRDSEIDAFVLKRMDEMARELDRLHPVFVSLPSDVQLAVLSMAWAMGPDFRYPKFWAALTRRDYAGAAAECTINPDIGTIIKRNAANKALLLSSVAMEAS